MGPLQSQVTPSLQHHVLMNNSSSSVYLHSFVFTDISTYTFFSFYNNNNALQVGIMQAREIICVATDSHQWQNKRDNMVISHQLDVQHGQTGRRTVLLATNNAKRTVNGKQIEPTMQRGLWTENKLTRHFNTKPYIYCKQTGRYTVLLATNNTRGLWTENKSTRHTVDRQAGILYC